MKFLESKLLRFILIVNSACLMQSCGFYDIYRPNPVFVPLLEGQGHVVAEFNQGTHGTSYAAATSPIEYLFVMGSVSWRNNDKDANYAYERKAYNPFYNSNSAIYEMGAGAYVPLNPAKTAMFELSAGYGFGNGENFYYYGGLTSEAEYGNYAKGKFNRFFVQPSLAFCAQNFKWALTMRISQLNIKDYEYYSYNYNEHSTNSYIKKDNSAFIVFEPVSTLKIGYKYLYFTSQFGFSLPLSYQPFPQGKNASPFYYLIANVGVSLNLPSISPWR